MRSVRSAGVMALAVYYCDVQIVDQRRVAFQRGVSRDPSTGSVGSSSATLTGTAQSQAKMAYAHVAKLPERKESIPHAQKDANT